MAENELNGAFGKVVVSETFTGFEIASGGFEI
jgi:hypothetical protein